MRVVAFGATGTVGQIGRPVFPLLTRVFPNQVITAEAIGNAVVNIAAAGAYPVRILDPKDINAAAAG